MCNTKFVGSMNYHIVSDDHQLFVRYAVRFQQIDNVRVFPAKVQAEKDEQAKKAEAEKKRLADLAAIKLILDAKAAQVARDIAVAKEAHDAQVAKDAKEASDALVSDNAHKARVAKMMADSQKKRDIYSKQRLDKATKAKGGHPQGQFCPLVKDE